MSESAQRLQPPRRLPSPVRSAGSPALLGRLGPRARGSAGPSAVLVIAILVALWGMFEGGLGNVRIATTVLMYAALAEGWNLLGGYAGYVNFGAVIFFGIGAYTTAITTTDWHLPALATVPLAGVAGGLAAVIIGIPALRLRGGYFAIATFVLTLAVQALAFVLGVTHGATGIIIPPLSIGLDESTRLFLLLNLLVALLATAMCLIVERSRWHASLLAIHEDEAAAEVLGVPTTLYKSLALVGGSCIGGLVGGLYAIQLYYIEPTGTFDFDISLAVVVAAVIGGAGTWWGPLIGAVVTQLLAQELLLHVQGVYNELAYGGLLVVVVLIAPQGLASVFRRARGRRFSI